jgi:alkylation response protein AidB-like acyl-CoA dehydrogenase
MMDHPEEYGPPFTKKMISKAGIVQNFAGDAATMVTNKTIELMGSNGLSPEYHAEKYFRDAKIIQVVLAGQQVRKYRIARGYYEYTV